MSSIYLATGHGLSQNGSWDPGCTDGSYTEADLMLPIAQCAVAHLRAAGLTVHTDADSGNDRNCTATIQEADTLDVDAYLALHADYNAAPSGTLPIIYPGSTGGATLAKSLTDAVQSRLGLAPRATITRDDDMEVRDTTMPACIFETGSIRADIATLTNPQAYGAAIAQGVLAYFGIATTIPTETTPGPEIAPTYQWDTWDVQYWATLCNYGAPAVDGIWGPETEACVIRGQKAYGIPADGLWGPETEAHASAQVRAYQQKLCDHDHSVTMDGIPGPETHAAACAFQRACGLEADGIVGEMTFPLLMG